MFSDDGGGPYYPSATFEVTPPPPPALTSWEDKQNMFDAALGRMLGAHRQLASQFGYVAGISAIVPKGMKVGDNSVIHPNVKIPLKSDGEFCYGRKRFEAGGRWYEAAVVVHIATGDTKWWWLDNTEPEASSRHVINNIGWGTKVG